MKGDLFDLNMSSLVLPTLIGKELALHHYSSLEMWAT